MEVGYGCHRQAIVSHHKIALIFELFLQYKCYERSQGSEKRETTHRLKD